MVSYQRLRKKLIRLGVLEKEVNKAKSIEDLHKIKVKWEKENADSNGSDPEGK